MPLIVFEMQVQKNDTTMCWIDLDSYIPHNFFSSKYTFGIDKIKFLLRQTNISHKVFNVDTQIVEGYFAFAIA